MTDCVMQGGTESALPVLSPCAQSVVELTPSSSHPINFCPFFQPVETFLIMAISSCTFGDHLSVGFSAGFICRMASFQANVKHTRWRTRSFGMLTASVL